MIIGSSSTSKIRFGVVIARSPLAAPGRLSRTQGRRPQEPGPATAPVLQAPEARGPGPPGPAPPPTGAAPACPPACPAPPPSSRTPLFLVRGRGADSLLR